MKISERIQSLYTPDRFNQQGTRVQKPNQQQNDVAKLSVGQKQQRDINDVSLQSILSVKEVNSLNALFGYEKSGGNETYGVNKIRNIHSGMLLDVKG